MSSFGTVVGTARLRVMAANTTQLDSVSTPDPSVRGLTRTATFSGGKGDTMRDETIIMLLSCEDIYLFYHTHSDVKEAAFESKINKMATLEA